MNYAVEWPLDAENDLAAAWLTAPDREAVTDAAAWIDDELATDPLHFGSPLDSSVYRIGFYDALGVEFEVIEDDKRVIVHAVFAIP